MEKIFFSVCKEPLFFLRLSPLFFKSKLFGKESRPPRQHSPLAFLSRFLQQGRDVDLICGSSTLDATRGRSFVGMQGAQEVVTVSPKINFVSAWRFSSSRFHFAGSTAAPAPFSSSFALVVEDAIDAVL